LKLILAAAGFGALAFLIWSLMLVWGGGWRQEGVS
jgi:hypothetical protein